MEIYDSCDKILKIHYEHYLEGPFDKAGNQRWHQLGTFEKICLDELSGYPKGYHRTVHHILTDKGYLEPIGELNDLFQKVHYITPKGYAFVITGGFKKQFEDADKQAKLSEQDAMGSYLGGKYAKAAFVLSVILGVFGFWQYFESRSQNSLLESKYEALQKEWQLYKEMNMPKKVSNPPNRVLQDSLKTQR